MTKKFEGEKQLGKGLATATGGALVGAAIGGPAGAVVGGAVGPLADYLLQVRARRQERAEALAIKAADFAGLSLDDFFKKLMEKSSVSDLGHRLLEIASKHEQPDRDNAIAYLISQALGDEETSDFGSTEILADILSELRGPHIEVLLFIDQKKIDDPHSVMSPEKLIAGFPAYKDVVRSMVRTLEHHGLILDANRLSDPPTNEIAWELSDLGKALVDIVLNARKVFKNDG
ncbi:hypothetical protein [Sulfitobacter sp. R86518]|uniref:hypothetical protein n=1 Tax=Sulfitobacter sp. R86518 TaxID=3093858 RepID=UPI0036DB3455